MEIVVGEGITTGMTLAEDQKEITATDSFYSYLLNVDDSRLSSEEVLTFEGTATEIPKPEEPELPNSSENNPNTEAEKPTIKPNDFNEEILKTTTALGAYAANFTNITDRILNKTKKYDFGNSVWADTYYTDEKLKYSTRFGDKDFDSETYITTAGFDYSSEEKNGVKKVRSLFFGHLKSNQDYIGVNPTQEAYYIGTSTEIIKKNRYAHLTLVGGRGKNEANDGSENFDTYLFSTALKLGIEYNFENNLMIEPSIKLGYHNIMGEDYTNGDDVKIISETMNIFNISPEVKFTKEYEGLKPYIALGYNYYGSGEIKGVKGTEKVELPIAKVENYLELRVGANKVFNEDLSIYGEMIGTRGDRDSLGGQIGFKWILN